MKQTGHIQTGCFFCRYLLSYLAEIKKVKSSPSPKNEYSLNLMCKSHTILWYWGSASAIKWGNLINVLIRIMAILTGNFLLTTLMTEVSGLLAFFRSLMHKTIIGTGISFTCLPRTARCYFFNI